MKIGLSNGRPITSVGELRSILAPFIDTCEINEIHVFYCPQTDDIRGAAKLEIAVAAELGEFVEVPE